MFFYLYSIVSILLYLMAIPFLLFFSFKKKYRESIPARFFLWKNPPLDPEGIWFHSCSFGEAKAIKPLVDLFPSEVLRMTTTTQTGKSVIDGYTKQSRYLPFEPLLLGWIRPQKALVVMEAEFWYLLFALAKRKGAKTLLVNARLNDRSYPKYLKMRWFYRQVFRYIDEIYAQTLSDKERLESLGAKNVKVTGNIKLAYLPKVTSKWEKPEGMLVCGASTHQGEEQYILDAFLALKKIHPDAKLAMAPRHPERFGSVAEEMEHFAKEHRLSMQRYTQSEKFVSDMMLLDTLGELVNLYAVSDLVILGGAFEPVGGHNAAEAAQFGCRVISGPYYFNQKDIFEAVEGICVVDASNLSKRVLQYAQIKPASIRYQSDIEPIIESLKDVL